MAYHLCNNDHYVSGSEGALCPAKGCQSKLGPAIGRTDPDPRGDDPFFYGKTERAQRDAGAPEPTMKFTNAAQCGHFLCGEVFPNIKAFQGHLSECPELDGAEARRLRYAYKGY